MEEKMVFCIIVTYNGMQWIGKCLESVRGNPGNIRIVVIDNNSTDNTAIFIKENYPEIQLITTGKNIGFGQGNNIGLALALQQKADHVFLLNQDAYVENDTFAKLVEVQIKNPAFGIVSPIHLNGDGSDFDNYFYKYLIKSDVKELISGQIFHKEIKTSIINTSFVNAAAWLISKECLKKTGGFDPIFFHYGEDDHYANRVLFNGFRIGILSTAFIRHDRKREPNNFINDAMNLKKEKTIFLNQACDLHNQSFKTLMLKRLLRYALRSIVSIAAFNKKGWQYNYGMVKHISKSFKKVMKSQHISQHATTPHLNIVN